ncbi:MAG: insulinase family protein [Fibromonadaceae bacterium]|jgi:zinc protease|nr:insulinase family protein [Fibromonadaceae bacterium]
MLKPLLFFAFVFLTSCTGAKKDATQPGSAVGQSAALPESYKDIAFPDFQYIAPYPGDYRIAISDSITLYAVRDTSLPLINLTFYFRENAVPKNKENAAAWQLLSPLYSRGGTEKLSPAAIDDSLEFLSARVSGGIGNTNSKISLNCLSRDFGKVLPLLFEIFNEPRLDSARLELQKNSAIQRYTHRYDQPSAHASALSAKVMYKNNPKLWEADSVSIAKIKRANLLSIKNEAFVPRRVIIAASGDFNTDSLKNTLAKLFANWKADKAKKEEFPPLEFNEHKGIFVSEKSISQANIIMAAPFVKRPHPDYYQTAIASYILGGSSFSSRLMNTVRTQGGLAYSVYSFAHSDYEDTGLVGVALQTKAESAKTALQMVREECLKLGQYGPTESELAFAKKSLIESMPGMFENAETTANTFAVSELNGRSLEHYREYPEKLKAVTAEQVKAMAAKYFNPDSFRVSVVGASAQMLLEGAKMVPIDSLGF